MPFTRDQISDATITSPTDSPEQVAAALGTKVVEESDTQDPSNTPNKPVGNPSASDASDGEGTDPESGDESGTSDEQDGNNANDPANTKDSDNDDDEDADEADGSAQAKGQKKSGYRKRVDRLKSRLEQSEAQRQKDKADFDRQLAEVRAAIQGNKPAETKPDSNKGPDAQQDTTDKLRARPQQKDFDTYDAFLEDMGKWTDEAIQHARTQSEKSVAQKVADEVKKMQDAQLKANQESNTRTQVEKQVKDFETRRDAFVESHKDYYEVIDNTDAQVSRKMQSVILTHEKGVELLYHFAKNAAESTRISKLSEDDQVLAIGEILAGMKATKQQSANGAPSNTKTTKAPAPPKQVKAKAKSTATGLERVKGGDTSEEAFLAFREARRNGTLK